MVSLFKRLRMNLDINGLSKRVAHFCFAIGALDLALGLILLIQPSQFEVVKVYNWVGNMPFMAWSILFLMNGALLISAGLHRKTVLARIGLAGHMMLNWLWALSFLVFSINEQTLTGLPNFIQWGASPLITLLVVRNSFLDSKGD